MRKIVWLLSLGLLVASACKTSQKTTKGTPEDPILLDDMEVVVTPPSEYRATPERDMDILHTKLAVSFDWKKQYLYGKAYLTLKPYFYPQSSIVLDAKGFDIHQVALIDGKGEKNSLEYTYDSLQLHISLNRTYTAKDTLTLFIDYTAKPNERMISGSAAISADKGLYFINPDGSDTTKPMQIWTQGETEANSCWFPTIDKPNEKSTEEIYITVDNRFTTLSNGLLISSTPHPDGTRTDYWRMDLPHSVYLFMMAIGEYEIVKDKWGNIAVDYYVEAFNAKNARRIFGETPQMLSFFSEKLGVKYPWQKYSQVIVRDYVSGAMENTTATIFGEFVNKDEKSLKDEDYHDIVAHELFHHWFGDLVTCESWSNLPLNESFADYSEYLWNEYRYGKDYADYKKISSLNKYFNESKYSKNVPLIRFHYHDKEDMFDAHSYEKGGAILHMLRKEIGDDAFFKSLNLYLNARAFGTAEINDLRMAVEQVTGRDMNYFFDQWFMKEGHPIINIEYAIDSDSLHITITQKHNVDLPITYTINTTVDIYYGPIIETKKIQLNKKKQTFSFKLLQEPTFVDVDPERVLLAERTENKTTDQYIAQYTYGKNFFQRKEALEALKKQQRNSVDAQLLMEKALHDKSNYLRAKAVNYLYIPDAENEKWQLMLKATDDSSSMVREAGYIELSKNRKIASQDLVQKALNDSSYKVNAAGLVMQYALDSAKGMALYKSFENSPSEEIKRTINEEYAEMYDDTTRYAYFVNIIAKDKSFDKFYNMFLLANYLSRQPVTMAANGANFIKEQTLKDGNATTYEWGLGALERIKGSRPLINLPQEKELLQQLKTAIDEVNAVMMK